MKSAWPVPPDCLSESHGCDVWKSPAPSDPMAPRKMRFGSVPQKTDLRCPTVRLLRVRDDAGGGSDPNDSLPDSGGGEGNCVRPSLSVASGIGIGDGTMVRRCRVKDELRACTRTSTSRRERERRFESRWREQRTRRSFVLSPKSVSLLLVSRRNELCANQRPSK